MIEIDVVKDKTGFIWQFKISGHAGYEDSGKDIVCSAISITALNASNAIEEIVGLKTDNTTKIEDGFLFLTIPTKVAKNERHDVFVIMQTALIGFKEIEKEYSEYVSVVEEEV